MFALCSEDFQFEHYDSPMKFSALKKLLIDFDIQCIEEMIYIDFSSCSESLETLETNYLGKVRWEDLRFKRLELNSFIRPINTSQWNFFIDSFKHLRNLKSLTLRKPIDLRYLFNYFGHLKNLRLVEK